MQEVATFGAGCFWGVEAAFRGTPGVIDTAVGYLGGDREKPTYKDVCTDETGHAEVVQVTFDPQKLSYSQLLDVFWKIRNPTQVNRQGPDFGKQYRTPLSFSIRESRKRSPANQSRRWNPVENFASIATEVSPAKTFWRAEEYHQRYLETRGAECCLFEIEFV